MNGNWVIYGLYGFIFSAGWVIMSLLFFMHRAEGYVKWLGKMELANFLIFFAILFLSLFGLLHGGFKPLFERNLRVLGAALFVFLLPSLIVLLFGWLKARKSPEKQKIENLKILSLNNPQDPVPHIALGNIYEKSGRWGKAIQEFEKAHTLYPEGGHRSRFQRKVESLEPLWEKEEREKTLECKVCHINNDPKRWTCEECASPLYQNPFQWVFAYLPMNWFIGIFVFLILFYFLGMITTLFALPIFLYLYFRRSIYRSQSERLELEAKIEALKKHLDEDPKNPVIRRSLSKIYRSLRRPGEALQELKTAYDLIPEDESGYRLKLKREIESFEATLKLEEGKKSLSCHACGAKNYKEFRNCEACGASLFSNYLHWAYCNFDPIGKKVVVMVPLLFSLFLIWFPFTYYLSLTFIWLFDILYFFYPFERFDTSWV